MKKTSIIIAVAFLSIANSALANFSGTWQTTWGDSGVTRMTLHQSGKNVTGTYTHQNGFIDGYVANKKTMRGSWTQSGNSRAGVVQFTLSPDGRSFTGKYNYDGEDSWTGTWNGVKIK